MRNLTLVRDYISKDSPDAAARVAAKLLDVTARLEQFPQSGRLGRLKGTRELVIPELPYIIPYRVVDDVILILSVIHTSRRWPKKLKHAELERGRPMAGKPAQLDESPSATGKPTLALN